MRLENQHSFLIVLGAHGFNGGIETLITMQMGGGVIGVVVGENRLGQQQPAQHQHDTASRHYRPAIARQLQIENAQLEIRPVFLVNNDPWSCRILLLEFDDCVFRQEDTMGFKRALRVFRKPFVKILIDPDAGQCTAENIRQPLLLLHGW